ncbi:MAG: O-methyltransferase [Microthrixaceae bacterium]
MANKGVPLTDQVQGYLLEHSIPGSEVQRRAVRETAELLGDTAIMQISEEQGPFLTFLTRLVGARLAVEIGTFTGLSAMCIAEGLPADGRLVCFDLNEQWTDLARGYWDDAGLSDRIELVLGPAADTLAARTFDAPVDLAFIDADKPGYWTYYQLLLDRMRPGGLVVVDNALYGGSVVDPTTTDTNARALREFNDLVAGDGRVDCSLINVGDGLMLIRVR